MLLNSAGCIAPTEAFLLGAFAPSAPTGSQRLWRHVFLGRPLFPFPSGFKVKACRVMLIIKCDTYQLLI